ncbi:phenylalanine--tRNA ligase subunit beta [bacterium]|nr:phenylalanine--tRNA ligase subunit beta [bacterium]MBU1983789.1 phenylalanine--tRNA ligase subunit beta [bacterium]
MIVSYRWLKELVDLPVLPVELGEILTFLGLEVEETTSFTPLLDNVVIGEVVECARVEGSDHLWITKTDVGGEFLPIVCGAPNTRAGIKVVVMLPGAVTADGMKVKKSKLRGIESFGMLASEREIGLSDDHTGIIEGDADWQKGAPAAKYLDLPDTLYDVEITPNRPDYLSHVGVARDVAAKLKLPWKWPEYSLKEIAEPASSFVSVETLAPEACPRYAARVVKGIRIARSPFAMRLKLTRCGVRPISNVVDVTNLLMLEFGQPLHAFDARFVEDRSIIVRMAEEGEPFVTLDGEEYKLTSQDLLIADPKKGVALAGIMGGLNSEIRDDTENVIIECAYFDPVYVRRSAKLHGLGTESSRRFERGMDPNGVPRVVDATAALMHRLGGGEVLAGRVDCYPRTIEPSRVSFRPGRVLVVVGVDIPRKEMKDVFVRLGCEVAENDPSWQVTCPTVRPDLEREIDLIEEVIRIYGYDRIPTADVSRVPLAGRDDPMAVLRRKTVDVMVGLGFHETLSVSMYTPNERQDPMGMPPGVPLKNPVTDDMLVLQGSVLPHLVRAAAANWQRGDRTLRLFEMARVFHEGSKDDPRTWERQTLAAIFTGSSRPTGWDQVPKPFDFYDMKAVLEVLAGKLSLDNVEIICYAIDRGGVLSGEARSGSAVFGKWGIWPVEEMAKSGIDADVGWLELDLGIVSTARSSDIEYMPLPRFPISWRDIAVVVDETVPVGDLLATIRLQGGEFLRRTEPVDLFRGEKLGPGKKSVAIRVEFAHPERSLESAEVDEWMKQITEALQARQGAVLR